MFGSFGVRGTKTTGMRRGSVGTLVSPDGIHWSEVSLADSMQVAADTANTALYDPHLRRYIAFSRNHCSSSSCNASGWGNRRETWSTSEKSVTCTCSRPRALLTQGTPEHLLIADSYMPIATVYAGPYKLLRAGGPQTIGPRPVSLFMARLVTRFTAWPLSGLRSGRLAST